jgi:hypothetical protein
LNFDVIHVRFFGFIYFSLFVISFLNVLYQLLPGESALPEFEPPPPRKTSAAIAAEDAIQVRFVVFIMDSDHVI